MKAENEKITIQLNEEEAREYFGDPDANVICVKRTEWATVKNRIDEGKYDKSRPGHVWHSIESKLRSQAIYGEKWRAKEHMRRI